MNALRVGLVGMGPATSKMVARLRRSPVEIEFAEVAAVGEFDATCDRWDDGEGSRVLITAQAPPAQNYLGVASSAAPNLFHVDVRADSHRSAVEYVGRAIDEMVLSGSTRVQVRCPVEQSWLGYVRANGGELKLSRKLKRFDATDYDYSSVDVRDDGVFDGLVVIGHEEDQITTRIRVQGYFEPLDGRFHWAGIAFGDEVRALKDAKVTSVEVMVDGGEPVPARLAEITPWGTVRITGSGRPPYPLEAIELLVRR